MDSLVCVPDSAALWAWSEGSLGPSQRLPEGPAWLRLNSGPRYQNSGPSSTSNLHETLDKAIPLSGPWFPPLARVFSAE